MFRKYLIPECHFEREILLLMNYSDHNDISKESGCTAVISKIEKSYKSRLAIGWIDQDPNKQINRPKSYFSYKTVDSGYKIFIKKKPNSDHFLLETQDEFEPWIESIGKEKGIRKEDFNMRFDLHEYSKAIVPLNAKDFFRAVVKRNPQPFEFIKNSVENIKKGKYSNL